MIFEKKTMVDCGALVDFDKGFFSAKAYFSLLDSLLFLAATI
jgi:hypothetical protein